MEPTLNLDWLTPQLAIGGRFPIEAAEHLARTLAIRRVVDLRSESRDDEAELLRQGIVLLHLPTPDRCAVSEPLLHQGVSWVNAELDAGERVYLHCEHGIGRCAVLALCVLVTRGCSPLSALKLSKDARQQVSPSPEQLEAFLGFSARWRHERGCSWKVPSFDELAAIAYRHLSQPSRLDA